jgi:3-hydroxyacyl-[acyl-carrier-protein] dehydratase
MDDRGALDFEEVRRLLPQAHPFLLLDRVTELVPGERIVGQKNVSGNEGFFQGHFPKMAIMPAALILEALAQATIVLVRRTAELRAGGGGPDSEALYLFGSVHARMHRPVFPGDVLRLEVKLVKMLGDGGAAEGTASVEGKPCTRAEMYFSRVNPGDLRAGRPGAR